MKKRIRKAVALRYDRNLPAPLVIAKGKGFSAEKIIKLAEEKGVAVNKNEDLAESLYLAEMYSFIPEAHYEIIAEILSFIIKM